MIISASYRTDIPAFYAPWFETRFRAGWAMVANPYGGKPTRVPLREGVDGYVLWTRHIGPFRPALSLLTQASLPFVVQYTLTGYPSALESSAIAAARAVAEMRRLAGDYGGRAVVWRYDPILVSDLTPPAWHLGTFAGLADHLQGVVDEVVVSFAAFYRKTARNLAAAARTHHFSWRDPPPAEKRQMEKRQMVSQFAEIAGARGMALTLCTQPELAGEAAAPARCIDAQRLSDVAGRPIAARTKGNRPGCLCAESRDIGDYDSCPHGCVYCYAVSSRSAAKRRFQAHDPAGEYLLSASSGNFPLSTPRSLP
jgi:hypothetical protein